MRDTSVSREIAFRVRDLINRHGTSQSALAKELGWPQQRLSRRLTTADYGAPFTADELAQVATALGVPLSALLPTESAPPPSESEYAEMDPDRCQADWEEVGSL